MSVYRRFHGHHLPSLITSNIADHNPLFGNQEAARALVCALAEAREQLRFHLHAWVIMPNHMHLVIEVPYGLTSGTVLRFVKGRFARRWNHRSRTSGAIWQTRFHERVLISERALLAAIEYVHANPVVAGLAEAAEDYVFSSAKAWSERSQAEPSSWRLEAKLLKAAGPKASIRPTPA